MTDVEPAASTWSAPASQPLAVALRLLHDRYSDELGLLLLRGHSMARASAVGGGSGRGRNEG